MAEQTTTGNAAELIHSGNTALRAGDSYNARQLFRRALEIDPDNADAWVGLAASVRPYREKREHLQRALQLVPDHREAGEVLAYVEARIAAGEVLAPSGVTVREPLPPSLAVTQTVEPREMPEPLTETLYCYNHPNRETGLRCTSCERPICPDCANPTPVGQICPECARVRRPTNYQVGWHHLLIAGVASAFYGLVMTVVALYVFSFIRFFAIILSFILGPLNGNLLVRGVELITEKKRGRSMQLAVGIGYGVGAFLPLIFLLLVVDVFAGLILAIFTGISIASAVNSLR